MTNGSALVWVVILLPYYFSLVIITTTQENTVDFIRTAAKAVTALVVTAVTTFATAHGFNLTDAQVTAISAFLAAVAVYLIPNKPAA